MSHLLSITHVLVRNKNSTFLTLASLQQRIYRKEPDLGRTNRCLLLASMCSHRALPVLRYIHGSSLIWSGVAFLCSLEGSDFVSPENLQIEAAALLTLL